MFGVRTNYEIWRKDSAESSIGWNEQSKKKIIINKNDVLRKRCLCNFPARNSSTIPNYRRSTSADRTSVWVCQKQSACKPFVRKCFPLHANQNNFRMKNFARGPPLQQRVNTVNRGTISEKAFRTTPRLSILLNAVFLFSVITGRLPFLRRNVIILKFELIPEKSSKT